MINTSPQKKTAQNDTEAKMDVKSLSNVYEAPSSEFETRVVMETGGALMTFLVELAQMIRSPIPFTRSC